MQLGNMFINTLNNDNNNTLFMILCLESKLPQLFKLCQVHCQFINITGIDELRDIVLSLSLPHTHTPTPTPSPPAL